MIFSNFDNGNDICYQVQQWTSALLKDLIKQEVGILESKQTDTNTNNQKNKAWQRIHNRQAISRTGGGPKLPSPSKEVVELVELIPFEFQEDFNEYDSNGPPTNVMTEVPETEGEQSCEVPCRPESTFVVLIEDENVEILLTSAPATPKVVND
ncbi:uncharacterized protein [Periplaneta americana]|uniref:uncharacterized protein n=1 Tax=Periplaneta americana TaxID=6978 RepID=UPI0037E99E76